MAEATEVLKTNRDALNAVAEVLERSSYLSAAEVSDLVGAAKGAKPQHGIAIARDAPTNTVREE